MRRLIYWIPFVVYSIVLVHLLLTPAEDIPPFLMNRGDKILHLTAFAGLKFFYIAAITEFFSCFKQGIGFILFSFIGLVLAGGIIEIIQTMVPGRSGSIVDFYFNVAGLFIGLLVAMINFYVVGYIRQIFYAK